MYLIVFEQSLEHRKNILHLIVMTLTNKELLGQELEWEYHNVFHCFGDLGHF